MKRFLLLILCFYSIGASAQLRERFPFNEQDQIAYSGIVNIESSPKKDLYIKGKEFFVNNFKSANSVIQMDSKEDGVIIGKGLKTIFIDQNKLSIPVDLHFTIKVEFKDNRYRYEIYGLNYESNGSKFSADFLFSREKEVEYKKSKKRVQEIADQYRDKTILTVENLISSLKDFMEAKKNDW